MSVYKNQINPFHKYQNAESILHDLTVQYKARLMIKHIDRKGIIRLCIKKNIKPARGFEA